MPRPAATVMALLVGGVFAAIADAQHPVTDATMREVPCSSCHTCEKPTSENPCLRACTRPAPPGIAGEWSRMRGPDVAILDELEDLYLPVPFDHRGHAAMSEMARGCAVCHHYTPEGAAHPACKSCHEVSPVREDMRKPSLKAAYHRQCLSCHREWSHETACEVCHQAKAGRPAAADPGRTPTKDDIMGQMHPPIPEPETAVYETKYKYVPGTKVTFRHKEHIHRFGFRCAECHHEDNCSRCHEEGKSQVHRVKTLDEHHKPCASCHDTDSPPACDRCHWQEGEQPPGPFDHAATGWPLGRYHEEQSCRVCHKAVRFSRLDRDCNACHAGWAPDNFDHAVTGQMLDASHADSDCEECHSGRQFDRPPTCDGCHGADEGIAFPEKRPGPVGKPREQGPEAKPVDEGRKEAVGAVFRQRSMDGFAQRNERGDGR